MVEFFKIKVDGRYTFYTSQGFKSIFIANPLAIQPEKSTGI